MKRPLGILIPLIVCVSAASVLGDVHLPSCFADHMVLQRDLPVPVWGTATAGEKIVVEFGGQQQNVAAGVDGKWMVKLPPLAASAEGRQLKVSGENAVTFSDVLVGEVWLASGQSNMDFTVAKTPKYYFAGTLNEEEEVAAALHPRLRMFTADWTMSLEPQADVKGTWKVCNPENVREFSAVAYFFARALQKELDVPLGILTCTYGASTAQAWISRDALSAGNEVQPILTKFDAAVGAFTRDGEGHAAYERASQRWDEAAAKARTEGRNAPRRPKNPDPVQDQHNPTVLFNGMIAPVIPYAIRGAIWYQGESSVNDAPVYPLLQGTLVKDWRARWGAGEFPFFYVQLAANNASRPEPSGSRLATFREAQTACLAVSNTGMAVTIDIGDAKNVHPKNKQDVGSRLARLALARTYGKSIEDSGPIFESMSTEAGAIRLRFKHVAGGLVAKNGPPAQFAVAGSDRKFVWADAVVDGDTVVLRNALIAAPEAARYAWADNPEGCNLYNSEGLPAAPFRTDRW